MTLCTGLSICVAQFGLLRVCMSSFETRNAFWLKSALEEHLQTWRDNIRKELPVMWFYNHCHIPMTIRRTLLPSCTPSDNSG